MNSELASARRIIRLGFALTAIALIAVAGVYVRALMYTPIEVRQGAAQKIFYVHAPAAWAALMAFSVVGIVSALYLWLKDPRLDLFAASSAVPWLP